MTPFEVHEGTATSGALRRSRTLGGTLYLLLHSALFDLGDDVILVRPSGELIALAGTVSHSAVTQPGSCTGVSHTILGVKTQLKLSKVTGPET